MSLRFLYISIVLSGEDVWCRSAREHFEIHGKLENREIYHGKSKIFVGYGWTSGPKASKEPPTRRERGRGSTCSI